jgi:hypothetical protein
MSSEFRARLIGVASDDLDFAGRARNIRSDKNPRRNSRDLALLREFLAAKPFLRPDAGTSRPSTHRQQCCHSQCCDGSPAHQKLSNLKIDGEGHSTS